MTLELEQLAAKLPEYVQFCRSCGGAGEYEQTYTGGCGAGYFRMMGRCDHCAGTGLRFSDASGRVGVPPASVRLQCEPALRAHLSNPIPKGQSDEG